MKSDSRYIMLRSGAVLVCRKADGGYDLPSRPLAAAGEIFSIADNCKAFRTDDDAPDGCEWMPLRTAFARLGENVCKAVTKAAELTHWDFTTRFCPSCGFPLRRHTSISKICDRCVQEYFPSPALAILVLVTDGDRALLVHARTFSRPFFGLVAGFVETGESLEECVRREVSEETTLSISDIRYYGSQPWPFPFSMMVGFTAKYESGEIDFADGELSDGNFFTRDTLPPLAAPGSLARMMIDDWINRNLP